MLPKEQSKNHAALGARHGPMYHGPDSWFLARVDDEMGSRISITPASLIMLLLLLLFPLLLLLLLLLR